MMTPAPGRERAVACSVSNAYATRTRAGVTSGSMDDEGCEEGCHRIEMAAMTMVEMRA